MVKQHLLGFLSGENSSNADLQQRRQLAAELQRLTEPQREQPGVVLIPVTQPSAQQHTPKTQTTPSAWMKA